MRKCCRMLGKLFIFLIVLAFVFPMLRNMWRSITGQKDEPMEQPPQNRYEHPFANYNESEYEEYYKIEEE